MGIRSLARELNLSIGTVSRALNDRPDVNQETRARVKAAALRTGYVPNQSGRSLRKGRTGLVAVVIPASGPQTGIDSGLFRVLDGTRRTLRRRKIDLIVLFRGAEEDPLENLAGTVQRRIADAVIVTQTMAHDPRIDYLQAAGVPFVTFGRSAGVPDVPFVDFDVEAVAVEAARSFLRDGHRHLALAVDATAMNYQDLLAAAFRAEVRRVGIGGADMRILPTQNSRLTDAARAAFTDPATAPTAILASHESIGAGLYADLAALGLRIGSDVALISTFPVMDAAGLSPSLSYFDTDLDAAGAAIGERLLALLAEDPAERRILPPAVVPVTFVPCASHRRQALKVTA